MVLAPAGGGAAHPGPRRRGPGPPCDDDSAGLWEYAETVVEAVGDRTDLVVVAQSFGGFTAPLVCDRVPVDVLVLLAGMVPLTGEPPGAWWAATGYEQARREQDERDGGTPDDEVACRDDRFFPAEFLRRVVRERLAITPDEMDGSHCVAPSRPAELADRLEAYRTGR